MLILIVIFSLYLTAAGKSDRLDRLLRSCRRTLVAAEVLTDRGLSPAPYLYV